MSNDVDAYVANAPEHLRPVAERVRSIVTDALPDAEEVVAWSRPTYKVEGSLVCYLTASKKHVTLGFGQGRALSDPAGLLEGGGSQMAHIKLRRLEDIDEQRVRGWLREAEQLAIRA